MTMTAVQIDQARQRCRKHLYAIQAEQAIGAFMFAKFRKQASESGLTVAAKNLSKQGVPKRTIARLWMAVK